MKRIAHPPPDVAYQRVHMHLAKLIVRRWRAAGVVRWLPDDEFAPRPAGDHLWDLLETPPCETQRFRCAICKAREVTAVFNRFVAFLWALDHYRRYPWRAAVRLAWEEAKRG
jgi:hypothetical protein